MPENPIFSPIDQFVEHESHTRFDVDVPTDLLDWEPRFGVKMDERKGQDIPDDAEERRRQMIEETWRRYQKLLERDGYEALRNLKQQIEQLREHEDRLMQDRQNRHKALEDLRSFGKSWCEDWPDETPMREVIRSGKYSDAQVPPRYNLKWSSAGSPPRASGSEVARGSGELSLTDECYRTTRILELDRPTIAFRGRTEVEDFIRTLKGRVRRERREIESIQDLLRLITFRNDLLERFLWTYEVAGGIAEATVDRVPNEVRKNINRFRHLLWILEILPSLHQNGQPEEGSWPSQHDLADKIDNRLSRSKLGTAPTAMVEGAAAFIRNKIYPERYRKFRPDFYSLLLEGRETFLNWAEELGLDSASKGEPSGS